MIINVACRRRGVFWKSYKNLLLSCNPLRSINGFGGYVGGALWALGEEWCLLRPPRGP